MASFHSNILVYLMLRSEKMFHGAAFTLKLLTYDVSATSKTLLPGDFDEISIQPIFIQPRESTREFLFSARLYSLIGELQIVKLLADSIPCCCWSHDHLPSS